MCKTINGRESIKDVRGYFQEHPAAMKGKEMAESFAARVIADLLPGWRMSWDFETGWCDREEKRFYLPAWVTVMGHWEIKEYALHEVAHAIDKNCPRYGDKHDKGFYEAYIKLLQTYMI